MSGERRWKVPHEAVSVTGMENPAEGLGKVVTGVDNAGDGGEGNITVVFPVLDSEMLNVEVT